MISLASALISLYTVKRSYGTGDGDGDASFQLKSDSLSHAHAQSTMTFYKHQDSRIMKAQELKTKTSANSDIKDNSSEIKLRGRLLASFQDDAKYEHVGQDTRSQGGKDDQDKQGKDLKISDIKTKTPQQNGVAERRNRTLIEAARTMLVNSKFPTTFWAKAVNTACYVLNRVLVIKPHNKTPYELIHGRTLLIDSMKLFGCLVTILNTRDHLGKLDGKADEGFFVGYSVVSKAMRVFNKRARIVEETLNIRFLENTPNVTGNGPD
ncbi:ribonuclease H-like domain-containing protein [Tanacetum coccineum]